MARKHLRFKSEQSSRWRGIHSDRVSLRSPLLDAVLEHSNGGTPGIQNRNGPAPSPKRAMNVTPSQIQSRCCWAVVVLYAIAMAWMESAAVFYLRSMMDRIEPYQPDPFPVIGGFASVELPREFATLVMLFAVGFLAGRTWRARIGYAAIAFGVWDIFYYVFLKMMCGWPHSLLDWDILFLLPLPWWGPVLAPVLISLLMILWGTFASQFERTHTPVLSNWRAWVLNLTGVALALYVF